MLSYTAKKERIKIKQRQAKIIADAKVKGKHLDRPRIKYPGDFKEVYDKWKSKEIIAVKAMKLMNLKKNSFYNLIKKY
ncbi:putative site-specific serine recombinase-resolvase family protein ResP [Clostridium perfringens]|uniref:Putative site-specific serine recombinase-resolvase family protein ResP n=1 Tax=Clostridium perfringens TaxID=1502 RepID=A0A2X3ILD6_CLOPF|nr:putative site-specific serine recombinase-resolvase family protein ResP [Clostridium perfringens]